MKKLWSLALIVALVSCGGANDGDANTDTTNFDRQPMDTGNLSPAIGDTSMKMDQSTGTDTTSRPYSGSGDTSNANKK